MLTANGQYLPPDFLQPLPTTLDAKNSPLALLAQTCSSIGKDPTPSKSLIPPLEKKKDIVGSEKSSSSPLEERKCSPSKLTDCDRLLDDRSKSTSSENKDIFYGPKSSSPVEKMQRSASPHQTELQRASVSCTSTTSVITKPISSANQDSCKTDKSNQRAVREDSPNRFQKDSPPLKVHQSRSPTPVYSSAADYKVSAQHPHSIYSGLSTPHWNYPSLALGGHGLPLDPLSAHVNPAAYSVNNGLGLSYTSALEAHHAALKSGMPSLSPYVQYARMRNPSGATTLVPVCRDPYCTNCQLSLQNPHLASSCTSPGCTQCAHEKSLQSLSALGLAGANPSHLLQHGSLTSGIPSAAAGLSSLHNLSSLYAQNLLSAQQGLPHACNWVSGNDYCGKRFATSEELLQHLRTHTTSVDCTLSPYGHLGLSQGLGDYAALHGYLGSTPGNVSPGSLRRMYPTSASPLGSSNLHTNRYHPYKSALPSMPSGLPSSQSLSSLTPYYNIYGQRIGAAVVP